VIHDPPERVIAKLALPQVLVPVDVRAELRLRVVEVDQVQVLKPDGPVERGQRLVEPLLGVDGEA